MTHVEKAIWDAVKKGKYDKSRTFCPNQECFDERIAFLDPIFWQALGKARGWEMKNIYVYNSWVDNKEVEGRWRWEWHRFIDNLAEGKDAESFFASLESANSNVRNVPNSPTKTI